MNTKNIAKLSIMVAIMCILSTLAIPTPSGVPLTLQTFSIALAGFYLGKKYGSIAVFIYIILGIIGLPVFAGIQGGIGRILAPSGGFILGFVFIAFFSGLGIRYSFVGLIICHLIGVLQFSFISSLPFLASIVSVSLPYIIKDILSLIFAYIISNRLKKIIPSS